MCGRGLSTMRLYFSCSEGSASAARGSGVDHSDSQTLSEAIWTSSFKLKAKIEIKEHLSVRLTLKTSSQLRSWD